MGRKWGWGDVGRERRLGDRIIHQWVPVNTGRHSPVSRETISPLSLIIISYIIFGPFFAIFAISVILDHLCHLFPIWV